MCALFCGHIHRRWLRIERCGAHTHTGFASSRGAGNGNGNVAIPIRSQKHFRTLRDRHVGLMASSR